ncbi:MAG: hypothetical protein ACJAQU_001792 [Loktanella salsilacus]|jgi:hypothetical protein
MMRLQVFLPPVHSEQERAIYSVKNSLVTCDSELASLIITALGNVWRLAGISLGNGIVFKEPHFFPFFGHCVHTVQNRGNLQV